MKKFKLYALISSIVVSVFMFKLIAKFMMNLVINYPISSIFILFTSFLIFISGKLLMNDLNK